MDYTVKNLIIDFVQELIQPNITLNKNETQERKKAAATDIQPVLHKIKSGEMLLREGERVTEVQLLKLKTLEAQTKTEQVLLSSLGAALIMLCLLITTYILHLNRQIRQVSAHNKDLLLIASVALTFFILALLSASFSEIVTIDGVRAIFEEGWGLLRASNTGPILVMRFEGPDNGKVASYRELFNELLKQSLTYKV